MSLSIPIPRPNVTFNSFCNDPSVYCLGNEPAVSELTTMVTDYLVSMASMIFGILLNLQGRGRCNRFFAFAFHVLAFQFASGGTEHGFYRALNCDASRPDDECSDVSLLWVFALVGQTLSMASFLVGSALMTFPRGSVELAALAIYAGIVSLGYGAVVIYGAVTADATLLGFPLLVAASIPSLLAVLVLNLGTALSIFTTASKTGREAAEQIGFGFLIVLASRCTP